ncbi:MAG: 50S ribosomal protein L22 [Candidatus Magasanikbacteria bacterium GW2011_GWD2_43_18]|uniref:Large ribosomal subunit protein uL22 n=1 Tax=Candidatus Magasanikbacteria bacterium GW2011_GWE2_42_7 TaxID=1619052 RepID=A0A0G1BCU2_9BACT|nr:MAG: 50S ribosomal protein L22 [Candidatus Magasanikbacteria bacterium GW2011_GWC2_42_27]KKS71107.1 MAG: 50S ribosomal protein L22 [Candidatus Magasanikbacteria bacterium GW2011_GWE2_42_7]KKT04298.1 MAG: 50S ribosomal protein L22 [Candidatus Magasanikbacteria bacterium GW2011_GWD2_43_18]KKT24873.1 MAG: 50S ribosomal protein L22 [Candidatus Magasanikbacteria bacterium GW2011_GWA2_43_9]HBB38358.1 50S ribosomal protein L22 [Candidatus Magasanikbacteria bacterium]
MKRQATAKLNNLRVAPRKVRLLVDLIRGMHAADALVQLKFSKKHAASSVLKLLRSAVANAEHNADIDIDTLMVKEAYVDGGPILYRWMPRAFGRAGKIRKRTSHITLVLEGDEKATKKAPKASTQKKEEMKEDVQTKNADEIPAKKEKKAKK